MPSPRRSTGLPLRLAHRRLLRGTRSWLSRSFGVPHEARVTIVARMLEGQARSAPAYWLQLCIALSLATLGLVLNGPAVVIGAMLVSPLMNPIVELGMGFAVGSPLISIRSLVRTFWSVVVVIAGAALLTAALPFHEVTTEVAARTSPTALDLLVAVFCALAAAFTTLRSASDGATAAAGTAIAIALVPPLCVVGFGLGTANGPIAQGAFLLFTANLCAILVVSALTFWLFGFNLVDTHRLEEKRLRDGGPLGRSARLGKALFLSRFGTWVRFVLPLVLVAIVWVPLTRALAEVSWQVRTRAEVQKIIADLPLARTAVRSSITLKHRTVQVGMVVVGKPSEARALQAVLATRIAEVSPTPPLIEVLAVPDLETMEEVARTLAKSELAALRPEPDLLGAGVRLSDALKEAWPTSTVGELRSWRLDLTGKDGPTLEVVHLGPALGASGEALLAALLSEKVHTPVAIREVAIPLEAAVAPADQGAGWLPRLAAVLDRLRADRGLVACVTLPPAELPRAGKQRRPRRERDGPLEATRALALSELTRAPADQVSWSPGPQWSVQVRTTPCPAAPAPP